MNLEQFASDMPSAAIAALALYRISKLEGYVDAIASKLDVQRPKKRAGGHGFLWLLALAAVLLLPGCVVRDNTRFNAAGEPWAREKLTLFMVKGEASKVREEIVETGKGDYTRKVSIGSVSGESELDKLNNLVAVAVTAAVKAAVPVPTLPVGAPQPPASLIAAGTNYVTVKKP